MTNKEKFLALVSSEKSDTLKRNKERIKKRAMLRESQKIAMKILFKLDELGWKQTDLAREMGVAKQQISKLVSGKENLSIETLVKLQTILDIPIFASYYESKMGQLSEVSISPYVNNWNTLGHSVFTENITQKTETTMGSLSVVYNSFSDNSYAA